MENNNEYKFLNQKDRNKPLMTEKGYEYQRAKGDFPKAKTKRDSEGFFLPKKIHASRSAGIICAVHGDTPKNRKDDAVCRTEYLAKEAYEHEIDKLICLTKFKELEALQRFATEDMRSDANKHLRKISKHSCKLSKSSCKSNTVLSAKDKKRKKILDGITWRYDWIQLNKKACYLFAEYTIELFFDKHNPVRFLKSQPEETRLQILSLGRFYDNKSQRYVPPEKDDALSSANGDIPSETIKKAEIYWRLLNQRYENERFRTEFIRRSCRLPEANRRLLDSMYESAWKTILVFKCGINPENLPAPWYDSLPLTDDEESAEDEESVDDENVNYKKNSNDDKEIRQDEM